MRILDSRRLTGPNLLLDGPGALLEVATQGLEPEVAVSAWRAELIPLLHAVGWDDAAVAWRAHAQGLSLAFGAPLDSLYAATEVNEAAWHAAAGRLGGGETPRDHDDDPHDPALEDTASDGDEPRDRDDVVADLQAAIARERKPELIRLAERARRHGVTLLADDRRVSVGLGTGSRSWPLDETAAIERIPWRALHDIPVALVTGTNGKTTTVRLLAAMAGATGKVAGATSTDRVTVGDEIVAVGDYSGPNGARTVLRDRRVEMAFLEVARGGILRRGLGVPRARAALVTNVAEDHLGEFGIFDLPSLADAKMVVAKVVDAEGRMVLNADDALLLERGQRLSPPVIWFTMDPGNAAVTQHLAQGSEAVLLDGDRLVYARGRERQKVCEVSEAPITMGGSARHNVANALGAIGVAVAMGLPMDAIRRGLRVFANTPVFNPGRANVWNFDGVTAIVDFAHNPHGLLALAELSASLAAERRALVIGQAGDREDEAIRELARAGWAARPDRVFIKEMESHLRGRDRGAVPELIESELRRLGARREALSRHDSELEAVRAALAWARRGDLLLLISHSQRDEVIGLIEEMAAR
jgi:cyanophycin synthetase